VVRFFIGIHGFLFHLVNKKKKIFFDVFGEISLFCFGKRFKKKKKIDSKQTKFSFSPIMFKDFFEDFFSRGRQPKKKSQDRRLSESLFFLPLIGHQKKEEKKMANF